MLNNGIGYTNTKNKLESILSGVNAADSNDINVRSVQLGEAFEQHANICERSVLCEPATESAQPRVGSKRLHFTFIVHKECVSNCVYGCYVSDWILGNDFSGLAEMRDIKIWR